MPPALGPGERRHAFFPSIAVNSSGDMAICYNRSSNYIEYVSIRAAGRLASDPLNTLTRHSTLKTSQYGWGPGNPEIAERWGDYSDVVPDEGINPGEGGDPCLFWMHHEYVHGPWNAGTGQVWGTWVDPWSICDP